MKRLIIALWLILLSGCTTGPFQHPVQMQEFIRPDITQEELRKDFMACEDEAKLNIHYENVLIEISRQNEYTRRCMERKNYQFKP